MVERSGTTHQCKTFYLLDRRHINKKCFLGGSMKSKIFIKETQKQKTDRRATRAVNNPRQYNLDDFMWSKYGIIR